MEISAPDRMKHKAHPTVYAGVRFRSRLEASWAAFFDQCGWQWEYEPYDLEGWTPDFAIKGTKAIILVEVKPISWALEYSMNEESILNNPELLKVRNFLRDTQGTVLVLGNSPYGLEYQCDNIWLGVFYSGWLNQYEKKDIEYHLDGAVFENGYHGYKFDIRDEWGSYEHKLSGEYDGDHHLQPITDPNHLTRLWRTARNLTQWRRLT